MTPDYTTDTLASITARRTVDTLAERYRLDVLTTEPGDENAENVRRFALSALLQYLRSPEAAAYENIIFVSSRAATSLYGIPLVAQRSLLQPCLRFTSADASRTAGIFFDVRELLFENEAELELAIRLYGPGVLSKSTVTGRRLERDAQPLLSASSVGALDPVGSRYVLFLGRRDETSNLGMLVEAYKRYRRSELSEPPTLIIAGTGDVSYSDPSSDIVDLEDVSPMQRNLLLASALALLQPSPRSDGRDYVLAAWSLSRPVVVNEHCTTVAYAVRRADGGWLATTKAEWADTFHSIAVAPQSLLSERGDNGNAYFELYGTAAGVARRFQTALARVAANPSGAAPAFYHLVSGDDYCDDDFRNASSANEIASQNGFRTSLGSGDDIAGDAFVIGYGRARDDSRTMLTAEEIEFPNTFDLAGWDVAPDSALLAELSAQTVCMFAGCIERAACIEQLIAAYAFLLSLGYDVRLVIAGNSYDETYLAELAQLVTENDLAGRILFIDGQDVSKIAAAYRSAALFWSTSESYRSTCCLIDAMWFDLPILAYASAPTYGILGNAGLMYDRKDDLQQIAGLAAVALTDARLREQIRASQGKTRESYVPSERSAGNVVAALRRTASVKRS